MDHSITRHLPGAYCDPVLYSTGMINATLPSRHNSVRMTSAGSKHTAQAPVETLEDRRFTQQQMTAITEQLYKAFGVKSEPGLPDVFRVPVAVPLRIGIKEDLRIRYAIATDRKDPRHKALEKALKIYRRSPQYQKAILNGKRRFGMNLKPAQPITEMDRSAARHRLTGSRRTLTPRY